MKKVSWILAIAALLAIALSATVRWHGSCAYNRLEHELTFNDASGNPIEGVELKVEDLKGNTFFCFPVTDFVPHQIPRSDKYGVMRFRHVSAGVEWDNSGWFFFGVSMETKSSPVYVCRFLHGDNEVHRVRYGKLQSSDWPGQPWEEVPKVKRRLDWSAIIPRELHYTEDDTFETHLSRLNVFFHIDSHAEPSRECSIARRNACRMLDKMLDHPVEDIEFPVIRRTIVVDLPK